MSIINEALKKTEEYLQKNAAKDNPLPARPIRPKLFLLYFVFLLTGLLLGSFIFNRLGHHQTENNNLASPSQNRKLQAIQAPQETTLPAIPAAHSTPPGLPSRPRENKAPATANFILNGIFYSDNNGYALVNNQIVRENDEVDGARVVLITVNTVELDNAGNTITLTAHR
ncbi:MAG: hypothetical protein V1670_00275 [Candidatus Omnitrophota bacterium]